MNQTKFLASPRAVPDFAAADEMAQWAVDNADLLATLHSPSPKKNATARVASVHSGDSVNGQNPESVN